MWAPIDKIKNGRNRYIQIVITTKCTLSCSNCTQFANSGLRKDYDYMEVEVFREAVRSLKEWPGVVAIFGGCPTVHPKFPELMEILVEEIPDPAKRGIWVNDLLKHGELVAKVFPPGISTYNANAHGVQRAADGFDKHTPGMLIETSRTRASWHSPILLDRNDFGISDGDWVAMREECDVNKYWSGAIVQRLDADGKPRAFAFFCEVAAALEGLKGPENVNGILAEPRWWAKSMDDFQHQVRNCCDQGCGVPLRRLGQLDRSDTYDYSKKWAPIVEMAISAKKKIKGQLHETMPEGTERATDYQAHYTAKPGMERPKTAAPSPAAARPEPSPRRAAVKPAPRPKPQAPVARPERPAQPRKVQRPRRASGPGDYRRRNEG